MKQTDKALAKMHPSIASKVADILREGEREIHSPDEIDTWTGLTRAERRVLRGIRKHMRTRTALKGSKGWTHATTDEIAGYSDYSGRRTRDIINGLKKKGVLEFKGKKPAPGRKGNYAIKRQPCCFAKPAKHKKDAKKDAVTVLQTNGTQ